MTQKPFFEDSRALSTSAKRQAIVAERVVDVWGEACLSNMHERTARVLEEAMELAQAHDLPITIVERLMNHVYSRPKGEPAQEAGGIQVAMLAYAEAADLDLDDVSVAELVRFLQLDPERMRRKHAEKARAGVAPSHKDQIPC